MASLAVLALALVPGTARAASFDCTKARTPHEKLICSNPELSRADEGMAAAYKAVLDGVQAHGLDGTVRDRLRNEQRDWLRRHNESCGITNPAHLGPRYVADTTNCLRNRVIKRIGQLKRLRDGLPISALIAPKRITEINKAEQYKIDVAYPTLPASIAGADVFNELAEKPVRDWIGNSHEKSAEDKSPADDDHDMNMSERSMSYQVFFASPRLISVQFDVYEYPGGAVHGYPSSYSLHVDLANRRKLTAVDVFIPDSGWEEALAKHALAKLKRLVKAREDSLFEWADENVPEVVSNLASWRLERDRAVITFNRYEVASYATGALEVEVPYAMLKPYLKPDGPLPPKRP